MDCDQCGCVAAGGDHVRPTCGHVFCQPCFHQFWDANSSKYKCPLEHGALARSSSFLSRSSNETTSTIEQRFSNPTAVICNGDLLYVTDFGNHCVKKLSAQELDFSYLDHFGGKGPNDGQFKLPIDLSTSPVGNVYVLFGQFKEHGIVMFDSDGKFAHYIGEAQNFADPKGIYFHDDKLYVTDVRNIKIFGHHAERFRRPADRSRLQPLMVLQDVIRTCTHECTLGNLHRILVWDAKNIIVTDLEKGVNRFINKSSFGIHRWHYKGPVGIISETDVHSQNVKPSGLCKSPNGFLLVAYGSLVRIFEQQHAGFSLFHTLELLPGSDIERINGVAVTSDYRKVVVCGPHGVQGFDVDTIWRPDRGSSLPCTSDSRMTDN